MKRALLHNSNSRVSPGLQAGVWALLCRLLVSLTWKGLLGRRTESVRTTFARRPVHLGSQTVGMQKSACILLSTLTLLLNLATTATAITLPGTLISNTAQANFVQHDQPVSTSSNTVDTTVRPIRTSAVIELLQLIPNVASVDELPTPLTQYSTTGQELPDSLETIPPPVPLGQTDPIPIDVPQPLMVTEYYYPGQIIYIKLTDYDQNLSYQQRDTVWVTLTCDETGDREVLLLTETNENSGIFTGYLPSAPLNGGAYLQYDGLMHLQPGCLVQADYTDPYHPGDQAHTDALVDPFGRVFNSQTGAPVDGAEITLINTTTNQPAVVYGKDGISTFPSTLISGGTATDSSGTLYEFEPGGYHYPLIAPGTYQLEISPPSGYKAPSNVAEAEIQGLPNAPFAIGAGSYGADFSVVTGPAFQIDIPVDPGSANLWIQKESNKSVVAIGDYVAYTIRVENSSETTYSSDVVVTDRLPYGLRYQQGSLERDGIRIPDPQVGDDGRTMLITLGDLAADESIELRYVAAIGATAQLGEAINRAYATYDNDQVSNTAEARIIIREDLIRSRAIIMGRVMASECDVPDTEQEGLANARVYLDDGTSVVTDENGNYHIEGVEPGLHVVQLDLQSLPQQYEVSACEDNNQFARRAFSQFVDIQGATMWRADFHVNLKPKAKGDISVALTSEMIDDVIALALPIDVGQVPVRNLRLTLLLPKGVTYLPSSSLLDNTSTPDPENLEGSLIYRFDEEISNRQRTLKLRVRIDKKAGKYPIRAMLTFDTPDAKNQRTPIVDNLIEIGTDESSSPIQGPVKTQSNRQSVETTGLRPGEFWRSETETASSAERETRINSIDQFNKLWLSTAAPGQEWLWPADGHYPSIPSTRLAVKHHPREKPQLLLDGEPVSGLNFDGMIKNDDKMVAVSFWRGVDLKGGENRFEVRFKNAKGLDTGHLVHIVQYALPPVHAEFLPEASSLTADGSTPPEIAIRLTDEVGHPAREGVVGQFRVNDPYSAFHKTGMTPDRTLGPQSQDQTYIVGQDGIAHIKLQPTTQAGQVDLELRLFNGDQVINAWLNPGMRDWILVGFAQGTAGYNTLSGEVESLDAAGIDEHSYYDGEVKFFAKGAIKGEWLLTLAYDSDKPDLDGKKLFQTIDPDSYYTLYGDGTNQQYEASSSEKLFVKLERDQFYALFGDFNTDLTMTDLAFYNRSLTGLKSEFRSRQFDYNVFASETRQVFVKDEIQGNGTSGLYRLSNSELVINSEKITLEIRDRFRSEMILETLDLNRHTDYDINYNNGTIFFKRPIPSKDENLNPIYIMVRYETRGGDKTYLNYGGRTAYRTPGQKVEVGASYIHEDQGELEGDLYGVDTTIQLAPGTSLHAEAAASDRKGDIERDGSDTAYLAEINHSSDRVNANAYYREQGKDFGLGQQNSNETGTRMYGFDASYLLTRHWQISGEAYRQYDLVTGDRRDMAAVATGYQTSRFGVETGLRQAKDKLKGGESLDSTLLLTGANWLTADQRLKLRVNHEQALSTSDDENPAYPTRLITGADYKLNSRVDLFAEQEFTWGDEFNTQGTRGGLRARPWEGGQVHSSLERQLSENEQRVFALFGLYQTWQLTQKWSVDFSVDRSQVIKGSGQQESSNNLPSPSGADEDFTAVSIGASYRVEKWTWWNRIETRQGDNEDTYGLSTDVVGEPLPGVAFSAKAQFFISNSTDSSDYAESNLRFGMAYRPQRSRWITLNRLDFYFERDDGNADYNSWRIVNNLTANYKPNRKLQLSLYYGLKYLNENIGGRSYNGFTDMIAFETRYNLTSRWDIGVNGSLLHTWETHQYNYSVGASVGYLVMTNAWVSLGYNVTGYRDSDFSGINYTAQGAYMRFRMKFDQQSVRDAAAWINK